MTISLNGAADAGHLLGPHAPTAPPTEPVQLAAVEPAASSAPVARQPLWTVQYRIAVATLDVCCMIVATIAGYEFRFGRESLATSGNYLFVGLLITVGWIVALQASGGYDIRHLATGPEEAKRVLRASAITLSVLAIFCYAAKFQLARGFVIGVIPTGVVLILVERAVVRRTVQRRRRAGQWTHRILAVGTADSVGHLLEVTKRASRAGLQIVGVCVPDLPVGEEISPGVPVLGDMLDAADVAARIDAGVVAVAGSGLGPRGVRELGWQLEGTARGMVVAPSITEIAGPRVHVSAVEGLPLVWLDQPQLGRLPRLVKRSFDVVGALLALLIASPLLVITALAVRLTSRGPVFFRQARLGTHGDEFRMLKFRSMYADAEHRRDQLLELNEQDGGGVLFKIRRDPRITPVGRCIRQFSIDELPQLFHVLTGKMSLVGPRPLATADSTYTGDARRRLLVRPGVTGLWQVSGRSLTTWEDAVRMDLYYVENWSLGLDITILFRTIVTVATRRGAF